MPLSLRDRLLLLLTSVLCLGVSGCSTKSSAPADRAVLGAAAFDWEQLKPKPTKVGAYRKVCQAPTATLDELEVHVTTLERGEQAHAPHRHPDEELIIVKEGVVEALVDGRWVRLGPGSVIFQACRVDHAIRNAGPTPATYHVIKWNSPGMLAANRAEIAAAKAAAVRAPNQAP